MRGTVHGTSCMSSTARPCRLSAPHAACLQPPASGTLPIRLTGWTHRSTSAPAPPAVPAVPPTLPAASTALHAMACTASMTPQPAAHMVSMHVHGALQDMGGQSVAAGHGIRNERESTEGMHFMCQLLSAAGDVAVALQRLLMTTLPSINSQAGCTPLEPPRTHAAFPLAPHRQPWLGEHVQRRLLLQPQLADGRHAPGHHRVLQGHVQGDCRVWCDQHRHHRHAGRPLPAVPSHRLPHAGGTQLHKHQPEDIPGHRCASAHKLAS